MRRFPALSLLAALLACTTDPVAPRQLQPTVPLVISPTGAEIITEAEIARQAEFTLPTKNWVLYTRLAGTGTFMVGPGVAPEGVGSMEFNTPGANDKAYLYNYDYVGSAIADLAALRYQTYRSAAPGAAVVSLNVQIDINGGVLNPGEFRTLVWEPYINPGQGAIVNNIWQTWDALNGGAGMWWVSGAALPTCGQATPCTWATILATIPSATVLGLGLNQGSGNPGTISAFDQLVVGFGANPTTTYDFEPWVTATARDLCKKDGWQTVRRADGSSFKNQGDCVSYVQTGR